MSPQDTSPCFIEIFDAWGRRTHTFNHAPLLQATRRAPSLPAEITGLLPREVGQLGPGCKVRLHVNGRLFLDAEVTQTKPQWGDKAKLILDKFVPFHEVIEFEARTDPDEINRRVARAYTNRDIAAMIKDIINAANGPLHYYVDHTAYPDGAQREHAKFLDRKNPGNELELAGITQGQWVAAPRIDATAAYAKDGDTIAGITVDGLPWPDLRLLMIDCEETTRNSHAFKRHPETEFWTDTEYANSHYKARADAAKAFLQSLIDTHGIDHIELNPHRSVTGEYDDRVDAYGRYIALIYGNGHCFNAAMVEAQHADIYLYQDGRYHDPAMQLKDYYSYTAPRKDSIHPAPAVLQEFDAAAGALEIITALAYAAHGYVYHVDPEHGLHFYPANAPRRVLYYDPRHMTVQLGRNATDLATLIHFKGNPFLSAIDHTYTRPDAIDEYGPRAKRFEYFSITKAPDAARLCDGLLQDLAYPAPQGHITLHTRPHGIPHPGPTAPAPAPPGAEGQDLNLLQPGDYQVGDLLQLRGAPLRRLEKELPNEYNARFTNTLTARITAITHHFAGPHHQTTLHLGPPLRTIHEPLPYILRSQPGATTLFEFRLDDPTAGLDLGFHLD